jgi:hypothetical protein
MHMDQLNVADKISGDVPSLFPDPVKRWSRRMRSSHEEIRWAFLNDLWHQPTTTTIGAGESSGEVS